MEIIFEFIVAFFAELVGPVFFEVVAEIAIKSISHSFNLERVKSTFMSIIGHALLAAIFATISLFVSNELYIKNHTLQMLNLFFTPCLAGIIMMYRGRWLRKNEREVVRINSFWYGFVFAFTYCLIRYFAVTYFIGKQ